MKIDVQIKYIKQVKKLNTDPAYTNVNLPTEYSNKINRESLS